MPLESSEYHLTQDSASYNFRKPIARGLTRASPDLLPIREEPEEVLIFRRESVEIKPYVGACALVRATGGLT